MTLVAAHEDGRADYSAEVGALASAGGDALVVGRLPLTRAGSGIIQAALDTGAFETFVFPPTAWSARRWSTTFGSDIDGSFGQNPGTDSEGAALYQSIGPPRPATTAARPSRPEAY